MPENLIGNPDTWPSQILVPLPNEKRTAASVRAPFLAIANALAFLKAGAPRTIAITASSTFDPSAYRPEAWVRFLAFPAGGGGGYGGIPTNPDEGGGGGGGGSGRPLEYTCRISDLPEVPLTVTIGAAGVGGTTGGQSGTKGGDLVIEEATSGFKLLARGGSGGAAGAGNDGGEGGDGYCGGGGGGGYVDGTSAQDGGQGGSTVSGFAVNMGGAPGNGTAAGLGGGSPWRELVLLVSVANYGTESYLTPPFQTVGAGEGGTGALVGSDHHFGGGGGAGGFLTTDRIAPGRSGTLQGQSGRGYGAGGGGGGGSTLGGTAKNGLDGAPGILLIHVSGRGV